MNFNSISGQVNSVQNKTNKNGEYTVHCICALLLIFLTPLCQLITRLHKYGMCLEPKMRYPILEDIGKHFIDRAAVLVKSGHKFVYVLDNIDWEEKAHDMRQEV